ncbi:hypothetical protein PGT21_005959 [Puccinia graminis f. sp. tritici]|uniref:Pseudouridine synthase I TruA alpha/beta domain-containing protein n=1 Tax=Puccinia graminis f. sp. tritici TaxID=56615 RepID=A0A5B0LWT6_PUCGR|nr:hypothetical protein PGT21_005959 [Puccinia graminis f. sp. tritici]
MWRIGIASISRCDARYFAGNADYACESELRLDSESLRSPNSTANRHERAAHQLIGEHDFCNFCKIDPSKQLTHFRRKILSAEIKPVLEISVIDRLFYTEPNEQPPSSSIITTASKEEEGCSSSSCMVEKLEPIDWKPEYTHASALLGSPPPSGPPDLPQPSLLCTGPAPGSVLNSHSISSIHLPLLFLLLLLLRL